MTRRARTALTLVLALALFGLFYLLERPSREVLGVSGSVRDGVPYFELDRQCRLVSVMVYSPDEALTNRNAEPLWHLRADSNSVPVISFSYGERIKGMKPSVPKAEARPLAAGARYRIVVEARALRGEYDFEFPPDVL